VVNRFRSWWFKKRVQRGLRAEVSRKAARREPIRLIIGAAQNWPPVGEPGTAYAGWLCTDISTLDALKVSDWRSIFRPASLSTILAEHVIEHWTRDQFRSFLAIAREYLLPGGVVRIAVPDGLHPSAEYIESVRPGGNGPGADDHKVLYDYGTLAEVVCQAGFASRLLEYFDEQGEFQRNDYNVADGLIQRSELQDPRNKDRPLSYTSLIIDCTLPAAGEPSEKRF
jgi:predicted SAM-dependent methyltransferase